MKKAFFALLFLSFAGAGVLFWLMRSSSHDEKVVAEATHEEHGEHADKEHGEGEEEHGEGHDEAAGEHKDAKLNEEDSHEAVASEHGAAKGAEHGEEHGVEAEPNAAVAHGGEGEAAAEHGEDGGAPGAAGRGEDAEEEDSAQAPPSLTIHTEPPAAKVWVDGKPRGETPIEIPLLPKAQMVQLEAEGYAEFTRLAPSDKEASGQLNWKIQLKEGKSSGHASHGAPKEKTKKVAAAPKKSKHEAPVIHGAPPPVKPAAETPVETALKKETAKESAKAATHEPAAKESTHDAAPAKTKENASHAAAPVASVKGIKTGKVGPYLIQIQSIRREGEWAAEVSAALSRAPASESGAFGCRVKLPDGSEWVRILAGPFSSKAEAAERLADLRKTQPEAFVAKSQKCLP